MQNSESNSFLSLEQLDLDTFVTSLEEMHKELNQGIESDEEYEGELDEPIATIENLLDLLTDVDDLKTVELHHGVAILAHLQLLHVYLNEFAQVPDLEEDDFEPSESKNVKKATPKKPKKATTVKATTVKKKSTR
jgi:hypothetical protein